MYMEQKRDLHSLFKATVKEVPAQPRAITAIFSAFTFLYIKAA